MVISMVKESDHLETLLTGNRRALAKAITLIESNAPRHRGDAHALVQEALPHSGKSIRIGITGTPGVGKSTFIEAFGKMLCERGHRVAVLAVDPTSSVTGGSILGDKTRMEDLAREKNAFIRPSPSGSELGGVARKSRETIILCEAAGYDVVLVETVGVGQSEVTVRSMVDIFLLLQIAGGGDELQGIKKGVIELADAIIVNKADGDNLPRSKAARAEFARIVHYLQPATPGWRPEALMCSAMTGDGIPEIWEMIERYRTKMTESGVFAEKRQRQNVAWLHKLIEAELRDRFYRDDAVAARLKSYEQAVARGEAPAAKAASELMAVYFGDAKADQ